MRNPLRVGATFVSVFLLAFILTCCATSPDKYSSPYLGGPNYRVFDVSSMDSAERRPILYDLYVDVRECTGYDRSFKGMKFYNAGLILVRGRKANSKERTTEWRSHAGLQVNNGWIYIRNGLSLEAWLGTTKHEIAHYLTRMPHPEVDDIMIRCGIPMAVSPEG